MKKLRKNFGKQIRQLRKARKLTQEKLAEMAKLEPTYLGAVERGERNLTIDNIEKIAKGFDIETYKLFLFHHEIVSNEPEIALDRIIDILGTMPEKSRKTVLQIVALCSSELK